MPLELIKNEIKIWKLKKKRIQYLSKFKVKQLPTIYFSYTDYFII